MKQTLNPKQLFLIDGLGAVLSAFMLGVVLVKFEEMVGMPSNILYLLSSIAFVFSTYSFSCYRWVKNWRPYLKIISVANLMYCCFTLALVIYLYENLTVLGLTYFILELIIVIALACFEFKVALIPNSASD